VFSAREARQAVFLGQSDVRAWEVGGTSLCAHAGERDWLVKMTKDDLQCDENFDAIDGENSFRCTVKKNPA
jgi:hypothetical protein